MKPGIGGGRTPHPGSRLAGVLGGLAGGAAGLGLGKLIGLESFWAGLILFAACIGIAGFLAQKLATR